MADNGNIVLRLSLKGANEVRAQLDSLGPTGRRMGQQIDSALRAPSAGMRALSAGVGEVTGAAAGATRGLGALGAGLAELGPVGIGVGAVLATVGAAAAVLGNQTGAALNWIGNINDEAKNLHVSAEALQEWRFAAEEAGLEAGAFDAAIQGLDSSLGKAQRGQVRFKSLFKELGLDDEMIRNANSAADILPQIADGLARVGTEAERAAIADRLGIRELLPLLEQGSVAIEGMRARARDLGLVVDNETAASMAKLDRDVKVASQALDVNLKQAFLSLAPTLAWFMQEIAKIGLAINDMMDRFRKLEDKSRRGLNERRSELEAQGRSELGNFSAAELGGPAPARPTRPSETGRYDRLMAARARWAEINAKIDAVDAEMASRDADNARGNAPPSSRVTDTSGPSGGRSSRAAAGSGEIRFRNDELMSAADGVDGVNRFRLQVVAAFLAKNPGATYAQALEAPEVQKAIAHFVATALREGRGGPDHPDTLQGDLPQSQDFIPSRAAAEAEAYAQAMDDSREMFVDNFASFFGDGLKAAANGDLGDFLKNWALNWLGQALDASLRNLGSMVFDQGGGGGGGWVDFLGGVLGMGNGKGFVSTQGQPNYGGGGLLGYATGTDYSSRGWFDVGEWGKERVFLPRGSRVTPHASMGDGGAGGAITYSPTISLYAPGADAQQLAGLREAFARYRADEPNRLAAAIKGLKRAGVLA